MKARVAAGALHPKQAKIELARADCQRVSRCHGRRSGRRRNSIACTDKAKLPSELRELAVDFGERGGSTAHATSGRGRPRPVNERGRPEDSTGWRPAERRSRHERDASSGGRRSPVVTAGRSARSPPRAQATMKPRRANCERRQSRGLRSAMTMSAGWPDASPDSVKRAVDSGRFRLADSFFRPT